MFKIKRVLGFMRAQAIKIGVCLLIALAFLLSVASPVSQALSARTHISRATVLTAAIRPHCVVTINSEFPGQVAALNVSTGKRVNVGDNLITLVDPDFELEYERARVHVETTARRLEAPSMTGQTASVSRAKRAVAAADERLAGFSLDAVQSNCEKAQAHLREVNKLVEEGVATDSEFQEARRGSAIALRDLQSEREHLSRLQEEVEIASSHLFTPAVSDQLNLRMELREAQTALTIASRRRDSQRILSTGTGTVLKLMVSIGDQIPSGFPLVQIGQLDRLDFDVPVDPLIARKLWVGQVVNVRIPTEPPTQMSAPIAAISLVPSQEQSAYTVRVTTDNPAPSTILVGLSGEVELPQ
jgi:multidrug resistance efflux pump